MPFLDRDLVEYAVNLPSAVKIRQQDDRLVEKWILRRAFELLHERVDDLALLMTLEMGKPLAESKGEIVYAAEFFRWFAEEAVRIHGDYRVAPAGDKRILTMQQPVGPSLLITPWNFPNAMITRKAAPALAAGCPVVIKPAAETPLSALALAALAEAAGRAGDHGPGQRLQSDRQGRYARPQNQQVGHDRDQERVAGDLDR